MAAVQVAKVLVLPVSCCNLNDAVSMDSSGAGACRHAVPPMMQEARGTRGVLVAELLPYLCAC